MNLFFVMDAPFGVEEFIYSKLKKEEMPYIWGL
jgi:hypothetical protein